MSSTLFASFEYLCYGSTAIIHFLIKILMYKDGPSAERVKRSLATDCKYLKLTRAQMYIRNYIHLKKYKYKNISYIILSRKL